MTGGGAGHLPAFPWRLRVQGMALVSLHWVEAERARRWIPPGRALVQPWPGRTLGGVFVARYGPGSVLRYRELIAGCATVWHRGRPALWASHVLVDDAVSLEAGRTLLGVPKEPASFVGEVEDAVRVEQAGRLVCRLRPRRPLWLWRQRVRFAALHLDARDPSGGTVSVHGNQAEGRVGLAGVEVEIPPESPLAELGLGRPLLGLCARDVEAVLGGAPFLPAHTEPASPPGAQAPDGPGVGPP